MKQPAASVKAVGESGTIFFNGSIVTITREGGRALDSFPTMSTHIPVTSIAFVVLKAPSSAGGYLEIVPMSGINRVARERSNLHALDNEFAVTFTVEQLRPFEVMRDAILDAISARM